jgi:hypothetical protein
MGPARRLTVARQRGELVKHRGVRRCVGNERAGNYSRQKGSSGSVLLKGWSHRTHIIE